MWSGMEDRAKTAPHLLEVNLSLPDVRKHKAKTASSLPGVISEERLS